LGKRVNTYVKPEDEELIEIGKKEGITPSYALIEGYKFLMNKNTQYRLLMEEREAILKRLSDIEAQAEGLKEEVTIDPSLENEIVDSLIRVYHRDGVIPPTVKDANRVKLNMSRDEFNQLLNERVISPCDSGLNPKLDLNKKIQPANIESLKRRAVVVFKNQYQEHGSIDESDVKMWAIRLDMEVTEFHHFLEEVGVHA
jgi:hypothetical protein